MIAISKFWFYSKRLFIALQLTKSADPDKYSYLEYDIEFDSRSLFSYPGFDWYKNIIIFWVESN